jgi:crotonobetainyl-CoA:carnitine CoA-transferase CaiB-like acyl-CoA transferase
MTGAPVTHQPLRGLRVVDVSRYLPGPFCSLQLAWLGAHVTVIEQPPYGDPLRAMPPLADDRVSHAYHSLRRGCEVLQLDLGDEQQRTLAMEQVADCDVFIESFRPGVAERLGVGPSALMRSHPGLIYASISGYGQTGPWAAAPGHDAGYEALSGLLEQNGARERPSLPAVPIADLAGGYATATAICAALLQRERSGVGAHIDISLTEAALSMQAMHLPGLVADGTPRGGGMLTGGLACYDVYRCGDGVWLSVAAIEPKFFAELLRVLDRPDLSDLHMVPAEQQRLREEFANAFAARRSIEWEQAFDPAGDGGGACVVRVLDPRELSGHPQLVARGAVRTTEHGVMPASPYVFDGVRTDSAAKP